MTDETKDTAAPPDQPVDAAVATVSDDPASKPWPGIAVQGNQALIVAQFADMDCAKAAYYALVDAEAKRASTSRASWSPTPTTRARSTSRR